MQPEQIQALAAEVALTIKAQLAPVLERLAVAETRLAQIAATEQGLGELRERVVIVETKAAQPVVMPELPPPVDLSPLMERIGATEGRVSAIGDLRDRVVTLETKAAQPAPLPAPVDLSPVLERVSTLEVRLEMKCAETPPILGALADLTKDAGAMRERIAVLETRPQLPGPPGEPGAPGKDGIDGSPGIPGLTYQGVYQEGKAYDVGDVVTWAGSTWHTNEPTTTKPGEGSKAWTLMVKRGRDGRDGKDAPGVAPVVSLGRR